MAMRPNEWGDFLAGSFGPVAFLWLVLGFIQQGHELKQNGEALRLQADELKNSVEQHKDLVAATREQVAAAERGYQDTLISETPLFQVKSFNFEETDDMIHLVLFLWLRRARAYDLKIQSRDGFGLTSYGSTQYDPGDLISSSFEVVRMGQHFETLTFVISSTDYNGRKHEQQVVFHTSADQWVERTSPVS